MARRLPKRGFTNSPFRKEIFAVNLGDIGETFSSGEVTIEALKEHGLVPRRAKWVKILGDGEFSKKLTISAHYFSEAAKEKLAKAGGVAQPLQVTVPPKTAPQS